MISQSFWHVLARVWSAIAFFHPKVQERAREWEDALVMILPEAERISMQPLLSDEQRVVLETLLTSLEDNATQLVTLSETQAHSFIQPTITCETLEGNIAYVQVHHWFDFRIAPGYFDEWEGAIQALNDAIEDANIRNTSALILDFRDTKGDYSDENSESIYINGRLRRELVARLFTESVRLPTLARVQQVGYHDPTQQGGALGGYMTEWVSQSASTLIIPASRTFRGRLVVLTAHDTNALLEPVLILLQRTGRALCIGEQSYAYHAYDQKISLIDDTYLQLRHNSLIYHDEPARYIPHIITDDPVATALKFLTIGHDIPRQQRTAQEQEQPNVDAEMLPSRPQRIMATIKLWTAMREFYAYRHYLRQWDNALVPAIEEAANANTREAYFMALQRLSAHCKGGHNFVLMTHGSTFRFANRPYGYAPALRLVRSASGEVVVAGPLAPPCPVQIGDILVAVDGEDIRIREERLHSLFHHYPEEAIDHYLLQALLDSPQGTTVNIRVQTNENVLREFTMLADHNVAFVTEPVALTTLPAWCMLPNEFANIGYLDVSRVNITQIDTALEELTTAKALIIDLRRYPTLPVSSVQCFQRAPIAVQTMLRPVVVEPEKGIFGWLENRFYDADIISPSRNPDMRPIAALIGGGTVSMGEDWTYQLLIGYDALLVGSVTAGGVGSNAFVHLPGEGRASFSGARLTKGALTDEIEGKGIAPHVMVDYSVHDELDIAVTTAAKHLTIARI